METAPKKDNLLYVRFLGMLRGTIWLPPAECEKPVDFTFLADGFRHERITSIDSWVNVRESLLTMTNDGDFQHCGLADDCTMILRYRTEKGIYERYVTLDRSMAAINDLFAL